MPANFLSLPSELRIMIYELLLVDPEPINMWGWPTSKVLHPQLLRVNKEIYGEASSLLYSQNRLSLITLDFDYLGRFLDKIGRNNAGQIRHLCIEFPVFDRLELHDITLEADSASSLARIQSDCVNLSTLETSAISTDHMTFRLGAIDSPHFSEIVHEALTLVDARFRAIASLQEIVVQVSPLSDEIRKEMTSLGWAITEVDRVEWSADPSLSGFSEGSIYGDDVGDSDCFLDEENDYDIDNDSDYWRRAAD